jgi:5-methyltetrahydrofolate--homocysteine methyltransferase
VQITGGISNLSFSFRGNNTVREAMHSVFLKHAAAAGMSMVIVNPAALIPYNDIEPQLRAAVEDVILNRRPDAVERLLEIARTISSGKTSAAAGGGKHADTENWRTMNVRERIKYAIVQGLDDYIEADVLELKDADRYATPLAIVEGPLMDGIAETGRLFGEARMYLPQVLRSAMVMKKAVAVLEPFIAEEKSGADVNAPDSASSSSKIVLATVKGDVHDIGKNIVSVVLACNGYEIIDLGVMTPAGRIIETAIREKAAIVGLSALISPSLDEMIHVAGEMEKCGLRIPLLIGGAAASQAYTALRIAPAYSGPAVYVPDAVRSVTVVRSLLSDDERPAFLESTGEEYREIVTRHAAGTDRRDIISLEAARANAIPPLSSAPPPPPFLGLMDLNDYPVEKIIPHIDWQSFLQTWEIAEKADVREKLLDDAHAMLERIKSEGLLRLRGVAGFFPAVASGDDVLLLDANAAPGNPLSANGTEIARFCFLRNQEKKQSGAYNPCMADFFAPPHTGGSMGLFALSAGFGLHEAAGVFTKQNDDYSALL